MTELTELALEGHKELIFPCDCADRDYLRISWDDTDKDWRYLWIENQYQPRGWDRVTGAINALLGRPQRNGEILLTDKTLESLREFINSVPGEGKSGS